MTTENDLEQTPEANDSGPLGENELVTYFRQVEEVFCQQRGAPLLLSPSDFITVSGWYEEGVSLPAAREGIEDYFARMHKRGKNKRNAIVLSFTESLVKKAHERHRLMMVARDAGAEPVNQQASLLAKLETIQQKLLGFKANPPLEEPAWSFLVPLLETGDTALEAARETLTQNPDADLIALDGELREVDRRLAEILPLAAPESLKSEALAEAEELLGDMGALMDPAAKRQTLDKLLRKVLRERLQVPRFSLFHAL